MSKNSFSVNAWKNKKFKPQFAGYEVDVLKGDGTKATGNTLLGTIRDTYSDEDL